MNFQTFSVGCVFFGVGVFFSTSVFFTGVALPITGGALLFMVVALSFTGVALTFMVFAVSRMEGNESSF